jgi:hypothetical protein
MNKKNIPNKTNLVPLQGLGVLFVLFFFFCSFSEPDYSWTTPSHNSSESMPCGGGDIGLNVWVENGDLLFYVSRSGAFDENNTMLKQGRFRIRLTPNPFLSTTDFRQTLESEQGELLAQLDEMNNKNTAQAEQLEQEADNNRRQLEQIKQLEIQLKAQQGRVDDLAERLEKQTNLNHQQAEKIERLTADLAAAQGENTHNIENIELLGNEIGEKRKEIGELGNKIANLEINLASWQGKANIFEQQLTKAEALTSSQAEKIEKLTADLATAKATVGATKPKTATEAKQEKANNEQPN